MHVCMYALLLPSIPFQDRLCGGEYFPNQTRTYYPRLKDDLLEYAVSIGTSLDGLDIESFLDTIDFSELTLTGICVDACPARYSVVCPPEYLADNPLPTAAEVGQCIGRFR